MVKRILREAGLFAGCAVLTGIVGLMLLDRFIMPRLVRTGQRVEVPDIVDLTPEDARRTLSQQGLRLKLQPGRWDTSVAEGRLVQQNPRAHSHVKIDRTVYAVPSLGVRLYEVPDLTEKSLRQAQLWIAQAGLAMGDTLEDASEVVREGLIISQDPPAGQQVRSATPISVTISNGPPGEMVPMPNLVGKPLETARAELAEAGLMVRDIRYEFSTQHLLNVVIRHIPEFGEEVKQGTRVRLVVSKL